jgi:hypothetical protein
MAADDTSADIRRAHPETVAGTPTFAAVRASATPASSVIQGIRFGETSVGRSKTLT